MEDLSKIVARLLVFIMMFLLFGGLPALFFHPKVLEASAKSISVSPWIDWREKSPKFFKKLSWSIRMPFVAVALAISLYIALQPFLRDSIILVSLPVGAMLGIVYYLKGPE